MHGCLHFPTPIFIPMLQYSSSSSPHACMATRSCHRSIPTLQHPCKHPSFHTHLHANPTPRHLFFSMPAYPPSLTPPCARVLFSGWGTSNSQASLPFPTDLAGAAFGVQRRCFGSGRLSLGYRRRPARRPLRLLPRRGRRRHQRIRPPAGAVASKAMHLHHPGAAIPASLSTSLLVEIS